MRQSWISVLCRFHESAATQFSKMISRSPVTQLGDDFWISIRRVCVTIPCGSHQSIFAINLTRRSCCRFHTSAVTKISVVISMSAPTLFSDNFWLGGTQFNRWFHASMMTLFSLLISCVNRELVFGVDSISQPRLNFQRWFLVLQGLTFRWRFMD